MLRPLETCLGQKVFGLEARKRPNEFKQDKEKYICRALGGGGCGQVGRMLRNISVLCSSPEDIPFYRQKLAEQLLKCHIKPNIIQHCMLCLDSRADQANDNRDAVWLPMPFLEAVLEAGITKGLRDFNRNSIYRNLWLNAFGSDHKWPLIRVAFKKR